jgi:hypothetical protein
MLLGHAIGLLSVPFSTEVHPPEVCEMCFVVRPVGNYRKGLGQSRMALHPIVKIAHHRVHRVQSDLMRYVMHLDERLLMLMSKYIIL